MQARSKTSARAGTVRGMTAVVPAAGPNLPASVARPDSYEPRWSSQCGQGWKRRLAGGRFTVGGQEFQRCRQGESGRVYAVGLATDRRRDLTHEESAAFWSWATVEVLRHTGVFSGGDRCGGG
jgi:hypothetical protein